MTINACKAINENGRNHFEYPKTSFYCAVFGQFYNHIHIKIVIVEKLAILSSRSKIKQVNNGGNVLIIIYLRVIMYRNDK